MKRTTETRLVHARAPAVAAILGTAGAFFALLATAAFA